MAKVTLAFEDFEGQVGMSIDLGEPFDATSNAHRTANMVLNWLDGIHQVIQTGDELETSETNDVAGPLRLVKTVDEINANRAASLANFVGQRIEVVRG